MYRISLILLILNVILKVSCLTFPTSGYGSTSRNELSQHFALSSSVSNENEELLQKLFPLILYITEFGKNATKVPLAFNMRDIDCFPIFHQALFQNIFHDQITIDNTENVGKKLVILNSLAFDSVENTVDFQINEQKYVTLKCSHRPQPFEELETFLKTSGVAYLDNDKIKMNIKSLDLQLTFNPMLLGFRIKSSFFSVVSPVQLLGTLMWLGNRKFQGKTLSKLSITYNRNSHSEFQHFIATCRVEKDEKGVFRNSKDILKEKNYLNKRKVKIISVRVPINVYTKPLESLFNAALTLIQLAKMTPLTINVPKEDKKWFSPRVYKYHLNAKPYSDMVANSGVKSWIEKCLKLHLLYMSPEIRKISWKTAKVLGLTFYQDKRKLGIALEVNYYDNWSELILDFTMQPQYLENGAPLSTRLQKSFFDGKNLISYTVVSVKNNYVSEIVNRAGVVKLNFNQRIYRKGKTIIFECCTSKNLVL